MRALQSETSGYTYAYASDAGYLFTPVTDSQLTYDVTGKHTGAVALSYEGESQDAALGWIRTMGRMVSLTGQPRSALDNLTTEQARAECERLASDDSIPVWAYIDAMGGWTLVRGNA